jgi:HNH endonuclease
MPYKDPNRRREYLRQYAKRQNYKYQRKYNQKRKRQTIKKIKPNAFYVCYACNSRKTRSWRLNPPTSLVLCERCNRGFYYQANREKILELQRRRRLNNIPRYREYYRRHREKRQARPCECGCGKIIRCRFVPGHQVRDQPRLRKYLRPEDVSTDYLLDFDSQSIMRKRGLGIYRICTDCGKKEVMRVSAIRSGRSTPRCHGCTMKTHPNCKAARSKGGHTTKGGYLLVRAPNHPFATKTGYVLEHRLVMEKMIGRYLKPWETAHHRNGVRKDNRPENLEHRTRNHGSGVRISDIRHCWTCRCAKKMKAIPTITLDFFMTTISTGTASATIA